jgi:3-hydroxyisobutyrate dehydrogenase-like beta-hydroxyacid dehydrogenase
VTVGFIGFGEAGSTIAGGLAEAGVDRIFAFDIAADAGERGATIQQRAARTGTILPS